MLITTKRNRKVMNKSYSYLLPLFNEECPIDGDYYVILNNVYTRYNDKDGYFVLCYHNSDNDLFNTYVAKLHENKLFVESYIDDGLIYLVFNFPENYKHEYNCYLKGRFSKFRESAKLLIVGYILSVHQEISAESIRKVLYKDEGLRRSIESMLGLPLDDKTELSSLPIINAETCYNFTEING